MSCSHCSRAIGGWLAGCGAATGILCAFALVILAITSGNILSLRFAGGATALLFPALLIFAFTCLLTGIPAACVIWLSETFRIRSVLFFVSGGAAIGVASQHLLLWTWGKRLPGFSMLFVVAGLAAGLAYWFVAGRHVGRDRGIPGDPV
jgi:hypothetical protein